MSCLEGYGLVASNLTTENIFKIGNKWKLNFPLELIINSINNSNTNNKVENMKKQKVQKERSLKNLGRVLMNVSLLGKVSKNQEKNF